MKGALARLGRPTVWAVLVVASLLLVGSVAAVAATAGSWGPSAAAARAGSRPTAGSVASAAPTSARPGRVHGPMMGHMDVTVHPLAPGPGMMR
jgi:hypothetical protein